MNCLIVSLESFQKGEIPPEVKEFILSCKTQPFIVLDESSKIKTNNPCKETKKSKRTQAILRLAGIGERAILTGTFMSKSPMNAYDQMNFLQKNFFPESMYAFASRYLIQKELKTQRGVRILIDKQAYDYIHKKLNKAYADVYMFEGAITGAYRTFGVTRADCLWIKEHPEYSPFKNMDDLWNRLAGHVMRVRRNDVLDLPPVIRKTFSVALTPEQKKLYLLLQRQHCTDKVTVQNGAELYIRFQDICNGYEPADNEENDTTELLPLSVNPKLDMLEEIVDNIQGQIVIWSSRTQVMYDAKKRLEKSGYSCGVYDGINSSREKDYTDFAEKKLDILLCNQASAGYGLDALKECDYAVYLCCNYSVEQRIQSEHRTERGVYKTSKYIMDITCKGTCEDRVTEALKQGKELVSSGRTETSVFTYKEE